MSAISLTQVFEHVGGGYTIKSGDALTVRRQTYMATFPSVENSYNPFGRLQVLLLGGRRTCASVACPEAYSISALDEIRTCDLLIASPTLYQRHYRTTHGLYP